MSAEKTNKELHSPTLPDALTSGQTTELLPSSGKLPAQGAGEPTEVVPPSASPQPEVPKREATTCHFEAVERPPGRPEAEAAKPSVAPPGYEIEEELGRGGMGVVYKARQTKLNRTVALKMILSGGHASAEDRERFKTEAEAVASLQHPHIVQIHDIGEQDGRPFFSLEFCPCGSLTDKLDGTPWPPRKAAELVLVLARAIHVAHRADIVHRDLKPANVLFAADGSPRITDFGLAKKMHSSKGPTHSGDVMGTPSYMAPEQAAGKIGQIGPATDIYALGAILYEMLTGRPPFKAATPVETVLHVINEELVPPRKLQPKLPRDLETLCLQCLRKEPNKRPASALALADDLQRFLDGEPIKARRPSPLERAEFWARKHPITSTLLAVAVALVFGVSVALWENSQLQQANRAAELVKELGRADIGEVSRLLTELAPYRALAEPRLRQLMQDKALEEPVRLRVSLALSEGDESQLEYLGQRLLGCTTRELILVLDRLEPYKDKLTEPLQEVLRDPEMPAPARFHAGLALARFLGEEMDWAPSDTAFLAAQLLETSRDDQRDVRKLLRPLNGQLLGPLEATFRDEKARTTSRLAAADALADLGRDNAPLLAQLASEATPEQYDVLLKRLPEHPDKASAVQVLQQISNEQPGDLLISTLIVSAAAQAGGLPDPWPVGWTVESKLKELAPDQRVRLGRRRAGAAITLMHLGEREQVGAIFHIGEDPEALTQFIHRVKDRQLPPLELLECLEKATDVPQRYALLLALGDYQPEELPAEGGKLKATLLAWYGEDPSSAIHSTCGWLLRRWGLHKEVAKVDRTERPYEPAGPREWFVERIGGIPFTFIVFRPATYCMGSPESEPYRHRNERQHWVTISRPFALSDRELAWGQFETFGISLGLPPRDTEEPALALSDPVTRLTYFEAILYCRWLTQQSRKGEESQCYDDPGSLEQPAADLLRKCVLHPERLGFRLPTEAEWECACRAGTNTAYSFGNDRELLKHYGYHLEHGSQPTGNLRPNLRGLFDMHGNVWEWCNDWYRSRLTDGEIDPVGPATGRFKVLRGGGWDRSAWHCRSAYRHSPTPDYRASYMGFRLARTLPQQ